jgi:hypothetical protein
MSRTDGGKPELFVYATKAELDAGLKRAVGAVTDMVLAGTVEAVQMKAVTE